MTKLGDNLKHFIECYYLVVVILETTRWPILEYLYFLLYLFCKKTLLGLLW